MAMSDHAEGFILTLGMARGNLAAASDQDLVDLHAWAVQYFGDYDRSAVLMIEHEQQRRREHPDDPPHAEAEDQRRRERDNLAMGGGSR